MVDVNKHPGAKTKQKPLIQIRTNARMYSNQNQCFNNVLVKMVHFVVPAQNSNNLKHFYCFCYILNDQIQTNLILLMILKVVAPPLLQAKDIQVLWDLGNYFRGYMANILMTKGQVLGHGSIDYSSTPIFKKYIYLDKRDAKSSILITGLNHNYSSMQILLFLQIN